MFRMLLVLAFFAFTGVAQAESGNGLNFAREAQQAESRREFQQAAALYTKAIESGDMKPEQVTDALRYRGNVNFFLGQFESAARDYNSSLKRDPNDIYAAIWLYMTREFSGQDGQPELTRATQQADLFFWPGPVVSLFLGKATIEDTLLAAKDPFLDDKTQREQACEAFFYAGQYALLQGDKAEAIRLFRAAVETRVINFIEYDAARLVLERLGG